MILAGDVGGTKTNVAYCRLADAKLEVVASEKYWSRDHASLEEIVRKFVSANRQPIEAACFGIAGPIREGRCETTNLPWFVYLENLQAELNIRAVGLLNDLEANAYGIAALQPEDFFTLNPGSSKAIGHAGVIAAGTGLGEAGLFWNGNEHLPFANEGGHVDFAPRNELEFELLKFLQKDFGRVSYERVLSGPGLLNIYRFLRDTHRGQEPGWLAAEMAERDASAVISQNALNGKSPLCNQSLDLFCTLYGAEAGNLALKMMALGGIYLGGGIAPKILERLKGPNFLEAFFAKGRLSPLLKEIPVKVILKDTTAVLGAARYALRLLARRASS